MVPLFAPVRQNETVNSQFEAKVGQILRSGEYILGKEVEAFDKLLAEKTSFRFAVGCANGTDALVLAMRALELDPNSEVITPAFSFIASASAVVWAGLKPTFADVDLDTACVSVETLKRAVTPKTRAIVAVDLFGRQAPMQEIRKFCDERGLFLIEDGAQSIGVPHHDRGAHVMTTSFYPTKNIGAMGDAGGVMTDDESLFIKMKEISRHGGLVRDHYVRVGTTSRIDAIQAALLNLKLPNLEKWTADRRRIAHAYLSAFADIAPAQMILPSEPTDIAAHVWALFTVRLPGGRRDSLMETLRAKGVGCAPYYPKALNHQPALKAYTTGACPNAELLASEVLSLPMFPELTGAEVDTVVKGVRECLTHP